VGETAAAALALVTALLPAAAHAETHARALAVALAPTQAQAQARPPGSAPAPYPLAAAVQSAVASGAYDDVPAMLSEVFIVATRPEDDAEAAAEAAAAAAAAAAAVEVQEQGQAQANRSFAAQGAPTTTTASASASASAARAAAPAEPSAALMRSLATAAIAVPLTRSLLSSTGYPVVSYTTPSNELLLTRCSTLSCRHDTSSSHISSHVAMPTMDMSLDPFGCPLIGFATSLLMSPRMIRCTTPECKALTTCTFLGLRVHPSSRVRVFTGLNARPSIIFFGQWEGGLASATSFVSPEVTAAQSAQAYAQLLDHGVINATGAVRPDFNSYTTDLSFLYTDTTLTATRAAQLKETASILTALRGPPDWDPDAPTAASSVGFNNRSPRQVVVLHCEDFYCLPGHYSVALPWGDSANVTDIGVVPSPRGLPTIFAIHESSTDHGQKLSTITVLGCARADCLAVQTPAEGGAAQLWPIDGASFRSAVTSGILSLTGKFTIKSGPNAGSLALVQYEQEGRVVVARCIDQQCTGLNTPPSFDRSTSCEVAPCADLRVSAVDSMPLMVYGIEPPTVVHCSNSFCVPYMNGS